MALEIRVTSPTDDAFVEHIVWNADEIAKEVEAKVGYYKNLVYTEDQVAEAKKDRAKLNKFVKALRDKDREIKDRCLAPYEEFHNQMLKIISLVEEPAELIDKQVKEYEEGQKRQKLAAINDLFEKKGFQPWVSLERIMNPKWLNKTYSIKQIDADLTTIQHKIGEDILLINGQKEGMQAALSEYKRSMDVSAAVQAGIRYVEAKRAEEELTRAMNAEPVQADAEPMREPVPSPKPAPLPEVYQDGTPVRKEIMFKVLVTREEMERLNRFLIDNHYTFRQINKAQAMQ